MKHLIFSLSAAFAVLCIVGMAVASPAAQGLTERTIYLTAGTTSWTVPADWNNANNTIQAIGAGGGGMGGTGLSGGMGGGGGAFAMKTNVTLAPGASISVQIGTGGSGGVVGRDSAQNGGDTFFNGATCAQSSVCAAGGKSGSFSGTGGLANQSIGSTVYSGGGSGPAPVTTSGTGGGGAATRTAAGAAASGAQGGAGGSGAGGAGGAADNDGSSGSELGGSVGAGGGGGGGSEGQVGKSGGRYGGGGGGGGSSREGGSGADGVIIITYTSALNVTVDTQIKGSLYISGELSKAAGTFVIDHPLDPRNKLLYHSFVESPDAKNVYDGTAVLDEEGQARIELPDYFEALNTGYAYQFFPMFEPMPNLYLQEEIRNNAFVIGGGIPGGKISWQVTGTRHDPYMLKHPIRTEVQKGPNAPVQKGSCLYEPLCE